MRRTQTQRVVVKVVSVAYNPNDEYIEGTDFSYKRTKEVYAMNFDSYQIKAHQTAQYDNSFYPFASLMVESAELADLVVKPTLRGDVKFVDKEMLLAEAGDVLWNLAEILTQYGLSMQDCADYNVYKLRDRSERGVIRGDGDKR
jgi:NTP pyrophosphatase (non-canonical NTP hydrolase)